MRCSGLRWLGCASLGFWLLGAAGCGNDRGATAATAKSSASKARAAHDGGTTTGAMAKDAAVPTDAGALTGTEGLVGEFMADAGDGWQSLIRAHWVVPAGSEAYRCARLTVTKDVALHEFRTLSPLGTHHTVLTFRDSADMDDGITDCSASQNAPAALFGSGVGTNDYTLPDGIALKLSAGDQLLINLHLFNTSDKTLEGTSGTLVHTMDEADVVNYAEAVLAGTTKLNIPPGAGVVQSGVCSMAQDYTLIAVLPHMHKQGVHLKAVAMSSLAGDVVLHDGDYSFDSQLVYPIDPVPMKQGDKLAIDCTYDNMTDGTLHFGESTLDEMCFVGLWRYPAAKNRTFICTN